MLGISTKTVKSIVKKGDLTEVCKGKEKIIKISELRLVICPVRYEYTDIKDILYNNWIN